MAWFLQLVNGCPVWGQVLTYSDGSFVFSNSRTTIVCVVQKVLGWITAKKSASQACTVATLKSTFIIIKMFHSVRGKYSLAGRYNIGVL